MASCNKKAAFPRVGNAADSSQDPLSSGFPTLVLPSSGCEGRPIVRTLSLKAPLALAIVLIVFLGDEPSQSAIRPILSTIIWGGRLGLFLIGPFVDCEGGLS